MEHWKKSKVIADSGVSRRRFIKTSLVGVGGVVLGAPYILKGAIDDDRPRVALIGVGGQGTGRLKEAISCGTNILALCDVDEKMLARAKQNQGDKLAAARTYVDYPKMLADEPDVEAVIIATPDHWHAAIARHALAAGKHVFCEKPLTHTIAEARALTELAQRSKLITQMGNQGSAANTMRRGIEVVQAGAIGKVRDVYIWVAKSGSFVPGQPEPVGSDPAPPELHWDNWVGPAPFHAYKKTIYHPHAWRAWYDFGGGSMADWGCHGMNFPVRALKLDYPTAIAANGDPGYAGCYPKNVRIRYDFAARGESPPVTVWWFDGGRLPPAEVVPKSVVDHFDEMPNAGVLVVGENGFTFGEPHPGSEYIQLANETKLSGILHHAATASIPQSLPRSRGHMQEWLDGFGTGTQPFSTFSIGGRLTEIVLSGVVALRSGQKLDWDGAAMRARNFPQADQFIHTTPRSGWA